MAIYKMVGNKERLDKVDSTSFGREGVLERSDLQRLLRDQPEVLEDGLLIISEEFGDWQDSNRRIDLLGLDAGGQLVVIELKRGETGEHMDLQAIRYAAMVANMTFQQVVDSCQAYLVKRARERGESVEEGAGENLIREHLGITEIENQVIQSEIPRIILVSENFSKELTTCVMWLNDSWLREAGQEVKCIRLQPHRNLNEILVETSQVVPLPEATDYLVRLKEREEETGRRQPSPAKVVQGGSTFKEAMESTPAQYRANMDTLYNWAVGLEQEKLAQLVTTIGSANVTLGVVLPQGRRLVTVTKYPYGTCISLSLRTLRSLSPNTALQVEKVANLDPGLWSANVWDITEELLTVLREAYREANGRLTEN